MTKLLSSCSRLVLAAPLALLMTAVPEQLDLSSGSIETAAAHAAGPGGAGGGGDRGGPGGRGGPGAGAAAAGQDIGQAGVSASHNETAYAATDPTTHGLTKAEKVLDTTPADQDAMNAVRDANAENDTDADSENEDFSLSQFGEQMSEDAKAALDAIAGLFSGDEE